MTHPGLKQQLEEMAKLEALMRQSWAGGGPRERLLQLEVALWRVKQEVGVAESERSEDQAAYHP